MRKSATTEFSPEEAIEKFKEFPTIRVIDLPKTPYYREKNRVIGVFPKIPLAPEDLFMFGCRVQNILALNEKHPINYFDKSEICGLDPTLDIDGRVGTRKFTEEFKDGKKPVAGEEPLYESLAVYFYPCETTAKQAGNSGIIVKRKLNISDCSGTCPLKPCPYSMKK